jgi:hypothetical protein
MSTLNELQFMGRKLLADALRKEKYDLQPLKRKSLLQAV